MGLSKIWDIHYYGFYGLDLDGMMVRFCACVLLGLAVASNSYADCTDTADVHGDHGNLLTVTSLESSTQFSVQALNAKVLPLYEYQGDLNKISSVKTALSGNIFSLCLMVGSRGRPTIAVLADLQNNLVSAPFTTLKDFNASTGVGVFSDPDSRYDLIVKPVFVDCVQPLKIALDHADVDASATVNPVFDQHDYYADVYNNEVSQQFVSAYPASSATGNLIVNYRYQDGKLYASQTFLIDDVALAKGCAGPLSSQ